jgi:NAD(P)-dependent dehydrogenase (short-subunit alcohol dehydrogenase family)
MDLALIDKVAVVTGAGSQLGMGKEIALTLAREGCNIVASDINLEGTEKTVSEIRSLGRQAIAVRADICNVADVKKMAAEAIQKFGRIDILVNVAGGATFGGSLAEMAEENIDKELTLNLRGAMNCMRAVLPDMLSRKSGKIVSISSFSARTGVAGAVVYGAAKEGIIGLTKGLAKEVLPSGINVNAIAPGLVLTEFYGPGFSKLSGLTRPQGAAPPPQGGAAPASQPGAARPAGQPGGAPPGGPGPKLTTTKDVANMVAFLVSDVSSNVTGQTISVDGGQFMI